MTSMNTNQPRRGEIWLVNFDPTIGVEIKKTRPGVVISSDSIGVLPLKLVAPLTEWKEKFSKMIWKIQIEPNKENGLRKNSSVDVLQIRGLDTTRLTQFIGRISSYQMKEICLALADIVESND